MNKIDRGSVWLWAAFVMLVLGSVVYALAPKPDASQRLADLDLQGVGFKGVSLPFSEQEQDFLGAAEAIKRRYLHGDMTMVMIAIDGTENRHVVHDPSFCYRGAGFEVTAGKTFPLLNGEGEILTLEKGDQSMKVAYWFSDGERRFTGFYEYVFRSALSRLTFGTIWKQPVMVTAHIEHQPDFDWAAGVDKFPFLLSL